MKAPTDPFANGHRDARGRFALGNPGGPGNPGAARVARLRLALLRSVSPRDVEAIVRELVTKAKRGDLCAARLILDRTLGPVEAIDVLRRLETVEAVLESSSELGR